MSSSRIWAPLIIGYVGGTVALLFESTIGVFLGVYKPLFGYLAADIYAGLAIGFVAALASRTWRGLLTLVLGLLSAGATFGVVGFFTGGYDLGDVAVAAFYFAFWLGLLGVPAYVIVTGIAYLVRGIVRATRPPEGFEPGAASASATAEASDAAPDVGRPTS